MSLKYLVFLTIYCINENCDCKVEKVSYISTERPVTIYYDKTYVNMFLANCRRNSRSDPRYYYNFYIDSRGTLDNNVTVDFYFYKFIQINRYRPTFMEFHFRACHLIDDPFFGPAIKRSLNGKRCPFPAGQYNVSNFIFPFVPKDFPFTHGRIYSNVSLITKDTNISLIRGYLDIEIKRMTLKKE